MKELKQTIGVDISKDDFIAHFEILFTDQTTKKVGSRKFANTVKGVKSFMSWIEKKSVEEAPLQVVMEATGRYHEVLAYHLHEHHYRVSIVLPNRIKYFAYSLQQFSKTDPIDASMIARYGSLQSPDAWQPASPSMRRLRDLSRDRQDIIKMRLQASNRLGAVRAGANPMASIMERLETQIALFNRQIGEIDREMDQLAEEDQLLCEQIERLCSVPHIGKISARTILAETGAFALFENRNQLIKYAGLDIVEKQSGSSLNGRGKISKRGNSNLRAALYMPAVGIIRQPGVFRDAYDRHFECHKNKSKALMAVQRKLLLVVFAMHQNQQMYDPNIHRKRTVKGVGEHDGSPTVARLAS